MTSAKPRRQALMDLLERVKGATADKQWVLVSDAARLTLDIGDPARSRINGLYDAGGFTDAVLMLVKRLLPGWAWHMSQGDKLAQAGLWSSSDTAKGYATASTAALALLSALLTALLSQEEDA